MVGWLLVGKVAELAADAAGASLRVLRPAWQPAYSFLTRTKAGKRGAKRAEKKDVWAEEVRKEAAPDETK